LREIELLLHLDINFVTALVKHDQEVEGIP